MKKVFALILSLCMVLTMTAVAEGMTYTPGTYTGVGTGMDGEVKIEVTFSENAITKIDVIEENETAGVGDEALLLIANAVLRAQSLKVDSVSGATVSSAAMKTAIEDAVAQAGGDVSALRSVAVETPVQDETYTYDVVVVGSGLAGLTAAVKASKDGAKVALVEKLGIVGGTAVYSSGAFLATTSADGLETLAKTWVAKNLIQEKNPMNAEKIASLVSVSPDVLALYTQIGVNYSFLKNIYFFPNASDKAIKNAESIKMASASATKKGGQNLVQSLEDYLVGSDVDIYLNMPATSLIQNEAGAVTGIVCETKTGVKTFNSRAVILCTGEYARNEAMAEEICPEAAHNYTASSMGATGEGITMALNAGGVLYDFQTSMSGVFCPDPYNMPVVGQPSNSYPFNCLLVNKDAVRPVSETTGTHDQMIYFICEGEADYGWVIMDKEIAANYLNLDTYLAKTAAGSPYIVAYEAAFIEELAAKMGVDAATLSATVSHYNELCAAGEDKDFGKAAEYLSALDDGTYYAVKEYNMTRGNLGGIVTGSAGEVLRADGTPVSGLYAAGIISSGAFLGDYYPGGEALGICAYMGYTAGMNAAEFAK